MSGKSFDAKAICQCRSSIQIHFSSKLDLYIDYHEKFDDVSEGQYIKPEMLFLDRMFAGSTDSFHRKFQFVFGVQLF